MSYGSEILGFTDKGYYIESTMDGGIVEYQGKRRGKTYEFLYDVGYGCGDSFFDLFYEDDLCITDGDMFFIMQKGKMYGTSGTYAVEKSKLKAHEEDMLAIYNKEKRKARTFSTEKFERILYVDDGHIWTVKGRRLRKYSQQEGFPIQEEKRLGTSFWWGTYYLEMLNGELYIYHDNEIKRNQFKEIRLKEIVQLQWRFAVAKKEILYGIQDEKRIGAGKPVKIFTMKEILLQNKIESEK